MSGRSAALLFAALLAGLFALLFFAPGKGTWIVDPDSAAYVGLARALADGDGYTFAGVPHAKFPPGFPAYLSLAILATDDPECYGAMRDLVTIAGLLSVLLAFLVGRRLLGLGNGGALLVALAAATSVFLMQYSVSFLRSETTFAVPFLLSLLAGEAWRKRGGSARAGLCGLLLGVAALVRTAGIAVLPALVLARALSWRPFRLDLSRSFWVESVVFVVVALLPPGAFSVRNAMQDGPRSPGYAEELLQSYALDRTKDVDLDMPRIDAAGMIDRLATNTSVLAQSLGKFVLNDNAGANLAVHPRTGRPRATAGLLLGLLLLGLVVAARRNLVVVSLVVPAYVGLYLIWPFNQQQRFYLPIQPILLALLALGAAPVLALGARAAARPLGRVALAVVVAAGAVVVGLGRSENAELLGRYSRKYALLLAALAAGAVALAVVAVLLRGRTLDVERVRTMTRRVGLGLLAAGWIGLDLLFWRGLQREHEQFVAIRAADPVPERFERFKGLPEMFELFEVLMREAGPDDLVMSDIPKIIHVTTGLRTTPLVFSSRDRTIELEPGGEPVRFLYFSREIPQVSAVFDEFLAAHPARFEVVHEVRAGDGEHAIPISLLRVLPE